MARALRTAIAFAVAAACACSNRADVASHDDATRIVATDSGYVAPDTLHEGLNHIVFENRGTTIHECGFIRLPDGMDAHAYVQLVKDGYLFPEGAMDCSGPGLTSPTERVEMWVPLEAGTYLLACWFRTHVASVPPMTIVVYGAPDRPVVPPAEDVTLELVDFRFQLTGEIERGVQTIRIQNAGPSMHEVDCFRLDGGRTVDELRRWMTANKDGSVHATAMGGALDSHDLSRVVWLRRTFTVGHYVLWCGMPMMQSGNEAEMGASADVTHAHAGMVLEFEVGM